MDWLRALWREVRTPPAGPVVLAGMPAAALGADILPMPIFRPAMPVFGGIPTVTAPVPRQSGATATAVGAFLDDRQDVVIRRALGPPADGIEDDRHEPWIGAWMYVITRSLGCSVAVMHFAVVH